MSVFGIERRTCACGNEFDALAIWDANMPCDKCRERTYDERIAAINAGRSYVVDTIGGACPTQAQGTFADGQRFYFRARHGQWWLYVDPHDAVAKDTADFTGHDETNGFMSVEAVLAILDGYADAS